MSSPQFTAEQIVEAIQDLAHLRKRYENVWYSVRWRDVK